MRRVPIGWLVAIWAVLGSIIFAVLRETYWALLVETIVDHVAEFLHIERSAMMSAFAPIIIAGTLSALLLYAAFRIGHAHGAKEVPTKTPDVPPQEERHALAPVYKLPRDVSLLDAVWRATFGEWGKRKKLELGEDAEASAFYQACHAIRQKAYDGELPIWARRKHSNLYEPLPQDYWRNRELTAGYMIIPTVKDTWVSFTHALIAGQVPYSRSAEWEHFMTNKETVEKLWPAKAEN